MPKESKKKSVEECIKEGTPFLFDGKLEEAAEAYRTAITTDPNDYSGWFHLSIVLFIGQQFDEAKEVRIKAQELFEKQNRSIAKAS